MRYRIVDGRIETRSLEVHLTDHCNLNCEQCCSLSPYLDSWNIDPDQLRLDLKLSKTILKPRFLKLTGGEPLLHPRLLECIWIAKESAIAPVVSVTTNGLLLDRMPAEFWNLLDAITVSVYPASGITEERLQEIEQLVFRHNLTLNVKHQDTFQEMTTEERRTDRETAETFSVCWLRHRCHMIRNGRFYLCTRPPHMDSYSSSELEFSKSDGLVLHDGPGMVDQLMHYLNRNEPLQSCYLCYGGEGEEKPHRLLSREKLRAAKGSARCES